MDLLIAANSVNNASRPPTPSSGTPEYGTDGPPGTTIEAYQFNAIMDEILAVIRGGGLTPNKSNNAQMFAAIQALIAAGVLAGFTQSLVAAGGWIKFKNGFIIQWGQVTVAQGAYTAFSLPLTFPNAAFDGVANVKENSAVVGSNAIGAYVGLISLSSISIGHCDTGSAPTSSCNYICWGK